MNGYSRWSYSPYRPYLLEVGEIYICRLAPAKNSLRAEWLPLENNTKYEIFYKERSESEFIKAGETFDTSFTVTGLTKECDYEIYVASGDKKSRVRLARTGVCVGNVVNYLHPDDEAYKFSGRYLCSPSLIRHPDGYLLASMDLYAHRHPQNLTLVFRSDDNGESWHYSCELMPCFWGKLFVHKRDIYMLACSTEYGDLLIGRSTDGGKSFSSPVCLLRGSNGKDCNVGVHKNPQNVYVKNGRIYISLEWGAWNNTYFPYNHAAMVMSCDINSDLLSPESWSFTDPVVYSPDWEGVTKEGRVSGTLEGTIAEAPDGKLLNLMRYESPEKKIIAYEINTTDPSAPLTFFRTIDFPANLAKFMIKRDTESGRYYTIASRRIDEPKTKRNLLSLLVSDNLFDWRVALDILDYRNEDPEKIGFQYVDFEIEGDDIIFLSRTAMNGANSFHDSNYSTFHTIKDFRKY